MLECSHVPCLGIAAQLQNTVQGYMRRIMHRGLYMDTPTFFFNCFVP